MVEQPQSLNEWVCLALLAERPAHGFVLARQLAPGGDLGRILTVRRPLVYRALDRLVTAGLAEPQGMEPGDAGPSRTVHRPSDGGRSAVVVWLRNPVGHVRDLRVEFLVKLRLLERRGLSPRRLIVNQRRALDDTLQQLIRRPETGGDADVVDLWRAANAKAVRDYLDQLERRSPARGR